MDLLSKLALGFHVATAWPNLLAALAGALLGTLLGILPRLNPVTAIAMLLPVVHALDGTSTLILLAAVYCGTQYAGVTTAVLVQHAPGALGTPVAAADGNQLVRQGRARQALTVGVLGSFFAGCAGTLVIALLALPLAELAFKFGAAETFSLLVLGLVGAVVLTSGSLVKSLAMAVLGMLLGQMGHDVSSGTPRFLLEIPQMTRGVNFVALAIGLFACGELIANLGRRSPVRRELVVPDAPEGLRPTRQDFFDAWPAVLRGSALGGVLGMLPGAGALLASFASYALEKNAGHGPRPTLGHGAIQGVAAPESAASAGVRTGFIPLLMLGVPQNAVMALMAGAMAIKGIQAGPLLMTGKPELFWGLIGAMWIGNLALALLNLPLPGLWRRLLSVPYAWLCPVLLLVCCFGVYIESAAGEGGFNVYLMAFTALMGYVFHKLDCEPTPLLLGFVLGPMMEESLRHALQLSGGDWALFVNRPLSAGLLAAALLLLVVVVLPRVRSKREAAFKGQG